MWGVASRCQCLYLYLYLCQCPYLCRFQFLFLFRCLFRCLFLCQCQCQAQPWIIFRVAWGNGLSASARSPPRLKWLQWGVSTRATG